MICSKEFLKIKEWYDINSLREVLRNVERIFKNGLRF